MEITNTQNLSFGCLFIRVDKTKLSKQNVTNICSLIKIVNSCDSSGFILNKNGKIYSEIINGGREYEKTIAKILRHLGAKVLRVSKPRSILKANSQCMDWYSKKI